VPETVYVVVKAVNKELHRIAGNYKGDFNDDVSGSTLQD
jgi:hypothetical protein